MLGRKEARDKGRRRKGDGGVGGRAGGRGGRKAEGKNGASEKCGKVSVARTDRRGEVEERWRRSWGGGWRWPVVVDSSVGKAVWCNITFSLSFPLS